MVLEMEYLIQMASHLIGLKAASKAVMMVLSLRMALHLVCLMVYCWKKVMESNLKLGRMMAMSLTSDQMKAG